MSVALPESGIITCMRSPSPLATWAILAELAPEVLSKYADDIPSTTLLRGSSKHSAIVNTLPGSEGLDQTLAERISSAHPRIEIFLLRLREDLEVIWVFKKGRLLRNQDDDPWKFARTLGCPLRQEPVVQPTTRSVCVVSGKTPLEVARALEYDDVPTSGAMHIHSCSAGAYFYSENGNVAVFRDDVANATRARVYLLASRYGGAEFYCSVVEDGKDVGAFEIPKFCSAPLTQLDSIEGKTTPREIAQALGVPPAVLGLDDRD
jgi:hypothetical protein